MGARHPQTILAHGLNGERLPIPNGTPLRVRLKLQLGDKMAKDIRAIEVTDTLRPYGEREPAGWEDRGYDWYAGIQWSKSDTWYPKQGFADWPTDGGFVRD